MWSVMLGVVCCPGSQYKVIMLPKGELDKANKDKKKHYPSNFKVERSCLQNLFCVHRLCFSWFTSWLSVYLCLSFCLFACLSLAFQVHVVLYEPDSTVDQVECEVASVPDDKDFYQDEENLSDTDPEDEW